MQPLGGRGGIYAELLILYHLWPLGSGGEGEGPLELGGYRKLFLPAAPFLLKTETLDCSHRAVIRSHWAKSLQV